MKQTIALLFDHPSGNGSVELSSVLTGILESHFEVVEVDSSTATDVKPVLAFVIFPESPSGAESRLESLLEKHGLRDLPYIVVVKECDPEAVTRLLQVGAPDFVTFPLNPTEVLPRVWRLLNRRVEVGAAPVELKEVAGLQQLVGKSQDFLTQVKKIPLIAKCDVNVLIAGETGTGKEVCARAIHYCGARAGGPFIAVNCGAIPADLVENELFGHERGAFTSAHTVQTGLIEEANGGTLFLDEIDCLPLFSQVKLLRFLQDKEYRPLGSTRMRRANVRIIAASNLNLEEAVGNGKLRQDLFYRLNIISFTLPPLRERRDDIPILAEHFLRKYCREFDREIPQFSMEALRTLMVYSWPGNVRELEHVIERTIVLCEDETINDSDVVISNSQPKLPHDSLQEAKAREIARFEKNYIQGVLSACKGNITRAAQVAQKNRRAFFQLIQKHQIDVGRFRTRSNAME